ncbi:hypothetical protein ANO11243_055580 [Dothideomycetidae sp. 11243]|nr:hypothetical protein ANO11243_055580 [fungal sp. No.11243]
MTVDLDTVISTWKNVESAFVTLFLFGILAGYEAVTAAPLSSNNRVAGGDYQYVRRAADHGDPGTRKYYKEDAADGAFDHGDPGTRKYYKEGATLTEREVNSNPLPPFEFRKYYKEDADTTKGEVNGDPLPPYEFRKYYKEDADTTKGEVNGNPLPPYEFRKYYKEDSADAH